MGVQKVKGQLFVKPQTQPQLNLTSYWYNFSWARHKNDFADYATNQPQKLNVSNISAVLTIMLTNFKTTLNIGHFHQQQQQ